MKRLIIKGFPRTALLLTILLAACTVQPTPLPTVLPTVVLSPTPVAATPTSETLPTVAAETATPEIVPSATSSPTVGIIPDISAANYLDDRSTPAAVMLSYFNAVNRHEYVRAYSYYSAANAPGTLESFSQGYQATQAVSVGIGPITSDGAAGSIFFTVPMVLNAVTTTGIQQKFAACYVLRLPQPQNYGAPPISPMHIERGTAALAAVNATDADVYASACPAPDYPTDGNATPGGVETATDISAANYIDNRSDGVLVLSSYFNAINSKEYVRAYSYWQTPPGAYEAFAAGYDTTASITAQFGTVIPDAGAGQIYYSVPVGLKATQTDGSIKSFVGCYQLHISQPAVQGTVPFQPLGIVSANNQPVDNTADLQVLLTSVCK